MFAELAFEEDDIDDIYPMEPLDSSDNTER